VDELLDIIRWNISDPYQRVWVEKQGKDGKVRKVGRLATRPQGEGAALSNFDKVNFVEQAVLCGFQNAQRMMGITELSPKFVVDIRMEKRKSGKAIHGWFIRTADGKQQFLSHEQVIRKRWTPTKKPKKARRAESESLSLQG
jgi:hypothetical protein